MDTLLFVMFLLVNVPIMAIVLDVTAQVYARRKRYTFGDEINDDFTLIVPIYGNIKYLENVEYLHQYGSKVVLCTTGDEQQEFYDQLQKIADDNGFRIFRDKPADSYGHMGAGQKRATSGTIRDRLIRNVLVNEVRTEYVVPIDADTTTHQPISRLVGELARNGWDIASIRLILSNRNGSVLTKLQYHEYAAAMQLRLIAPWMLSGACHVARTEVLKDIMSRHSLFFQGNDIEIGLIATTSGYKVGHIPFDVSTAVPATFNSWFRQRLAWAGGEFRLFITNLKFALKYPFWWVYGGLLTVLLFPLRWYSLFVPLTALLFIFGSYYALIVALHFRTRDRWIFLMPFYRMFCSLILTPLGIIWYIKTTRKDRNYGVIRPGRSIWKSNTLRSKLCVSIVLGILITAAVGEVVVVSNEKNQESYSSFIVPLRTGPNLLLNPSFEPGTDGIAKDWAREYDPEAIFSLVTTGENGYAQHISETGTYNDSNEKVETLRRFMNTQKISHIGPGMCSSSLFISAGPSPNVAGLSA